MTLLWCLEYTYQALGSFYVPRYTHSLYLVLLDDGDVILQIIQGALGLPDEQGLSVFCFDPIERVSIQKAFIGRINELRISRSVKEMIIEEKQVCFGLNNSIFTHAKPSWRSYYRLFKLTAAFAVVVSIVILVARRGALSYSRHH